MSTMRALVVESAGKVTVKEIEVPKLRENFIKIKVLAVALNPTDWKSIDYVADKGAIAGVDISGEVVEIGSNVKSKVPIGDKVYGPPNGCNTFNHADSGFAEDAQIKDKLFVKVPSNPNIEAAATLPAGGVTCGQGLIQALQLPLPNQPVKESFPLLIYGGSTATGILAIQLARRSGLTVIATASKHNHETLKKLGADAVTDYHDTDVGARIRDYTNDKLHYGFDCITEHGSDKICADALSSKPPESGLHYSGLLHFENFPRDDVKSGFTWSYTAYGETYNKLGTKCPALSEDYEFASKFLQLVNGLIKAGKVKPIDYTVKDGGLDGAVDGLQELKDGELSGTKLVYKIASA